MTTNTKTRTIAGRRLTLEIGATFLATRPMASRGLRTYPVTISRLQNGRIATAAAKVDGLNYDEANRLINGFNNGRMSFDGRTW